MTLSSFNNWLNNYLNFEKSQTKGIFWLDSMRFLCERLRNPQDKIKCIHVAGSKGKGSASAMIASIIEEAGFKCGIYTSPHITDFRERISTPKGFFEDEVYEKSAEELTSLVDSIPLEKLPGSRPLTWFELVTVFAMLCFKNAECDYVVYEVGLGGRLDSTNVVKPLVSVLMPIELEHTEFLGDTIEKIAFEKAGIIKEGIPAVVSHQNYEEANEVFKKTAFEKKAPLIFSDKIVSNLKTSFSEVSECSSSEIKTHPLSRNQKLFFTLFGKENYSTHLKLYGKVQAQNAVTAVLAIRTALPFIKKEQIEKGLSKAFLPGRFEVLRSITGKKNLRIILDGAHTPKSITNTVETLSELLSFHKNESKADGKVRLLFACAGDKDIKDIAPLFKNHIDSAVLTKPQTVRNCNPQKGLEEFSKNRIEAKILENLKEALSFLIGECESDDIILVTGSFYLVSEVKETLKIISLKE